MSGRVRVRYCREPTVLQYNIASERLVPSSLLSGEEDDIGELIGFAKCILYDVEYLRCTFAEKA